MAKCLFFWSLIFAWLWFGIYEKSPDCDKTKPWENKFLSRAVMSVALCFGIYQGSLGHTGSVAEREGLFCQWPLIQVQNRASLGLSEQETNKKLSTFSSVPYNLPFPFIVELSGPHPKVGSKKRLPIEALSGYHPTVGSRMRLNGESLY